MLAIQTVWFPPFLPSSFSSVLFPFPQILLKKKSYLFVCFGSCCSTQDLSLWRERSVTLWLTCQILAPRPGIKHLSSALQGGFLTTGPPGKSPNKYSWTTIMFSEVAQSCPTLCDPMDCSLPDSCVCGILQARVLEWVAISFCRGSSPDPGIEPGSPTFQADALTSEPPRKQFSLNEEYGEEMCICWTRR